MSLWAIWGYGTAYWTSGLRTFIVGLIPGLFASLVYVAYGMRANGHQTHSLVTSLSVGLTTLGYGDVTPMGLARGFAIIESAYGMPLVCLRCCIVGATVCALLIVYMIGWKYGGA